MKRKILVALALGVVLVAARLPAGEPTTLKRSRRIGTIDGTKVDGGTGRPTVSGTTGMVPPGFGSSRLRAFAT